MTAVQAGMSFDSMRRPVALAKRFWICVPPHCSLAGCQLEGIRPAVPATGRGVQVRNGTIGAEHLALVGHQHDVMVGQVLGENRHLPLDLHDAANRSAVPCRCP